MERIRDRREYRHNYYLAHKELELKRASTWAKNNLEKNREIKRKFVKKQKEVVRFKELYDLEYRRKYLARLKAERDIRFTSPCSICGSSYRLVRHHPDYSKPLEVIILCNSCHAKEHKRLRDMKNGVFTALS